jgi:hypothetical protein
MPIPSKPNDPYASLQKVDLTGLYLVDDRHDSIRTGQLVHRDGDYVMILLDPVQDMPERIILLTMKQLTETHQECGCQRWSLFPTAAARDDWMRALLSGPEVHNAQDRHGKVVHLRPQRIGNPESELPSPDGCA